MSFKTEQRSPKLENKRLIVILRSICLSYDPIVNTSCFYYTFLLEKYCRDGMLFHELCFRQPQFDNYDEG